MMQRSQRRLTLALAPGILAFLIAALSVADMFLPRPYDGVILEADVPGARVVESISQPCRCVRAISFELMRWTG